jgi:hypothetical protein
MFTMEIMTLQRESGVLIVLTTVGVACHDTMTVGATMQHLVGMKANRLPLLNKKLPTRNLEEKKAVELGWHTLTPVSTLMISQ